MEYPFQVQNGPVTYLGHPPVFAFSGLNVYECHKKS